jgi:serine/threonine protein kinase
MSKVGAAGAAGLEIPGYTIGARIGAGGFGEVYEARQRAIGRDVAIKVLHALAWSPDGTWLVTIAGGNFYPQLVPAAGGPMRTIQLDGWVDGIAWGRDPDHFLVSGVDIAGRYFALARVSLAGIPERVWSSTSTFFADIHASGRSDRIATAQRTYRQQLLVLER